VGIDPFDYLVTPRVLALAVAGPLLVIYANVMGLLGGMFVGVASVGLPAQEYVERMLDVLTYRHGLSGLLKGLAFGVATAMVACYYGLRAAREHAEAVGEVVRRAVVAAVVGVVLWDAAITLFFKSVRF
jgi:phospholipid/cholesterol/gamma-HCH transport system permease protein